MAESGPNRDFEALQPNDIARLDLINENFDDVAAITELGGFPEDENEVVLLRLMKNIARNSGDIEDFFYGEEAPSVIRFGFYYDAEAETYQIPGAEPMDSDKNLADYILFNLDSEDAAVEAGIVPLGGTNYAEDAYLSAFEIAQSVSSEAYNAKMVYDQIREQYGEDFSQFEEDFELVATRRQLLSIEDLKKRVKTETATKLQTSKLEVQVKLQQFASAVPTNQRDGALLWLSLNEMERPGDPFEHYSVNNIDENLIAFHNGRFFVPYRAVESETPEDEADRVDFTLDAANNLEEAIELLEDPENEYLGSRGKKIAEYLRQGRDIYDAYQEESETYGETIEFQKNYELLGAMYGASMLPAPLKNMWIDVSDLSKQRSFELPEEFKSEDGPWYFVHFNGEYFARNIGSMVDKSEDTYYKFDENKGWRKLATPPKVNLPVPKLYTRSGEVNEKAIEAMQEMGIDPRMMISATFNASHKGEYQALTDRIIQNFDYLHFPPIKELEIGISPADDQTREATVESLNRIQTALYEGYATYFVGMDPEAIQTFSARVAETYLHNLSHDPERNPKGILMPGKTYKVSLAPRNGGFMKLSEAMNPENTQTNESATTLQQQKIAEIEALIDGLILSRLPEGLGGILELIGLGDGQGFMNQLYEKLGMRWGEYIEKTGKDVPIWQILAAEVIGFSVNPEQQKAESGNVFGWLFGKGGRFEQAGKDMGLLNPDGTVNPENPVAGTILDMTDKRQLSMIVGTLYQNYPSHVNQGQPIFNMDVIEQQFLPIIQQQYKGKITAQQLHALAMQKMPANEKAAMQAAQQAAAAEQTGLYAGSRTRETDRTERDSRREELDERSRRETKNISEKSYISKGKKFEQKVKFTINDEVDIEGASGPKFKGYKVPAGIVLKNVSFISMKHAGNRIFIDGERYNNVLDANDALDELSEGKKGTLRPGDVIPPGTVLAAGIEVVSE